MNVIDAINSSPLANAIGIALIHLSWQGLLIGGVLSMVLLALRESPPSRRYAACMVAMIAMFAAPLVTVSAILLGVADPLRGVAGHVSRAAASGAAGWMHQALPWLTVGWGLGATGLQLRLALNWIRAKRLKMVGVSPLPVAWMVEWEDVRRRMGIARRVRVVESALARVPSVVGCLSPIVLVPAGLVGRLAPPQIRGIIAHELAHIRRHDHLVNLLQNVFESLFFFHPITWWVSDRLRAEREYCCDDLAMSVCGNRLQYAQALTSLDEFRARVGRSEVASTGGPFMNRILRILGQGKSSRAGRGRWIPPIALLAAALTGVALIVTGCDNAVGDGPSSEVVTPQVEIGSENSSVTTDVEAALDKIAAAEKAGRLTAEQAQELTAMFEDLASKGAMVRCEEMPDGACRVTVCAPVECAESALDCATTVNGPCKIMVACDPEDCAELMEGCPEGMIGECCPEGKLVKGDQGE